MWPTVIILSFFCQSSVERIFWFTELGMEEVHWMAMYPDLQFWWSVQESFSPWPNFVHQIFCLSHFSLTCYGAANTIAYTSGSYMLMWHTVLSHLPPPPSDLSAWLLISFDAICSTSFCMIILAEWSLSTSKSKLIAQVCQCCIFFFGFRYSIDQFPFLSGCDLSVSFIKTLPSDKNASWCIFQAGALTSIGHIHRSVYWDLLWMP